VQQGTVRVGANDGIATPATVSIGLSAAATLDLGGFNQSLAGINQGANAATIGNSSTTSDSTLTTTGTSTYDGLIQDALGAGTRKVNLTVAGGLLTLAGANTYSGVTTVSGGTLLVNNTTGSGTGTGDVTVNSGGTLGGTGIISGVVTVNTGGTLSPGAGPGTLTLNGSLVLTAGSTNTFEVDGSTPANDQVVLGADVTYGGVLDLVMSGTFTNGQTFVLFSGAGATSASSFSSIAGSPGAGLAFSFTNGVLSVVSAATPPSPTPLIHGYSNGVFTLSWPGGQNWRLEMQTNSLSKGLGTNWMDITPGSASSTNIPVDPAQPATFYRLAFP
jgi:autotransporter-associated beta strand protein